MLLPSKKISSFRSAILRFYRNNGRTLPWRRTRDPYRILVSEIMLQQTQVSRVLLKYHEFLKHFPDFPTLAASPLRKVLRLWQGLGYNRRALALKRIANIVVLKHGGKLPRTAGELEKLPGIGSATAGAICAFAYNMPVAFVETNIRRAVIHHFFPQSRTYAEYTQTGAEKIRDENILELVAATMDKRHPREWYWALMDYGAMLGEAKRIENPNRRSASYRKQSPFRGSSRELRGKILRLLLRRGKFSFTKLARETSVPLHRIQEVAHNLQREGLLSIRGFKIVVSS